MELENGEMSSLWMELLIQLLLIIDESYLVIWILDESDPDAFFWSWSWVEYLLEALR